MRDRITIKVGSNVLTRKDGSLDVTRMSAIVDQIAQLYREGHDVILVSSGAVASGMSELKGKIDDFAAMDSVSKRQLFSAVGQAKLIDRYYELFAGYGLPVGQVLTMKENFSSAEHCQNQKNCMEVMLNNGVIPIVNENDTVCVTELMFTDNDELSALVAYLMGAGRLVILSNVDGIFDGDPASGTASLIREIAPGEDLSAFISDSKSSRGRGGMGSKSRMAGLAAACNIDVYIANGKKENILIDLVEDPSSVESSHFIAYDSGADLVHYLMEND